MFAEARIDVTLSTVGGRVTDVGVRSSRPVQASRLFAGRRPDEVAHLLPTVFSLCGTAQRLACLAAVENASGSRQSAPAAAARRAALLAETVSEHVLAMARDWPGLIGEGSDLAAAKRLRVALAGNRPDVAAAYSAFVTLLGDEPETILSNMDAFQGWIAAQRTPAARLFADVAMERLAAFGASSFQPMPEAGPPDLSARLAADDGTYVACPEGGFETGPLARLHRHPLVAELMVAYGNGLLPRLAARLVEAASALQELDRMVQDSGDEEPFTAADGDGIGLVEATRGLLAHRVELRDGRVRRYQILAPTEWNFQSRGPLVRGLMGVAVDADLARRARLLVHAFDPCVACSVTVE